MFLLVSTSHPTLLLSVCSRSVQPPVLRWSVHSTASGLQPLLGAQHGNCFTFPEPSPNVTVVLFLPALPCRGGRAGKSMPLLLRGRWMLLRWIPASTCIRLFQEEFLDIQS